MVLLCMQISASISVVEVSIARAQRWERQFVIASPFRELVFGTKECTADNIVLVIIDAIIRREIVAATQHTNLLDCEFLSSRN